MRNSSYEKVAAFEQYLITPSPITLTLTYKNHCTPNLQGSEEHQRTRKKTADYSLQTLFYLGYGLLLEQTDRPFRSHMRRCSTGGVGQQ